MKAALPAVLLALMSAAPAWGQGGERQCFYGHQINGFRADGRNAVNLRVGVKDVYRLELLGPCSDIDFAEKIGVEGTGAGPICSGLEATLIVPRRPGPPQRCAVRSITRLSEEQAKALPAELRP